MYTTLSSLQIVDLTHALHSLDELAILEFRFVPALTSFHPLISLFVEIVLVNAQAHAENGSKPHGVAIHNFNNVFKSIKPWN